MDEPDLTMLGGRKRIGTGSSSGRMEDEGSSGRLKEGAAASKKSRRRESVCILVFSWAGRRGKGGL
jgi:hypothetical protein